MKLFKVKRIDTWTWEYEIEAKSKEELENNLDEEKYDFRPEEADFKTVTEIEEIINDN